MVKVPDIEKKEEPKGEDRSFTHPAVQDAEPETPEKAIKQLASLDTANDAFAGVNQSGQKLIVSTLEKSTTPTALNLGKYLARNGDKSDQIEVTLKNVAVLENVPEEVEVKAIQYGYKLTGTREELAEVISGLGIQLANHNVPMQVKITSLLSDKLQSVKLTLKSSGEEYINHTSSSSSHVAEADFSAWRLEVSPKDHWLNWQPTQTGYSSIQDSIVSKFGLIGYIPGIELARKTSPEPENNTAPLPPPPSAPSANIVPTLNNALADQSATQGIFFSYQFTPGSFSDADGDALAYSALQGNGNMLPTWLSFNVATHTLSGTANNSQVGTYTIKIIASDGHGGTVSDEFTLTVANSNDAPVISVPLVNQAATEDAVFSYTFSSNAFTDVDGDVLVYSAVLAGGGALPAWLSFDSSTLTFSGTPTNADVGSVAIEVTAADGNGGSVTDSVALVITNTNDAPMVTNALINQTAAEDTAFFYSFSANSFADVDIGDTLSYSAMLSGGGTLPSWLSFNPITRTFSGTATNNDVGSFTVDIVAADGHGSSVTSSFAVSVTNTNDAPTVANALADQTGTENVSGSYQFASNSFTDIDVGDTLTYSSTLGNGSTLPSWMSFSAATRTLSWTAGNGDAGSYNIKVTASDGHGGSVTDEFTLSIAISPFSLTASATDQIGGDSTANNFTGTAANWQTSDTITGGGGTDALTITSGTVNFDTNSYANILGVEQLSASANAAHSVIIRDSYFTRAALDNSLFVFTTGATSTGISFDGSNVTNSAYKLQVSGGGGADSITGGAGNDTIYGSSGADSINGGGGSDTVSYAASASAVTIDLNSSTAQSGGDAAGDILTNIENIIGSSGDDSIIGSAAINIIDGGAGTDRISYASSTAAVNVDLTRSTAQSGGYAAGDILSNFENLTGSAYADTLTGNNGNNTIIGGDGNDTMYGGNGDDLLQGGNNNDYLYGGNGNDSLDGGASIDFMYGGVGDDFYLVNNTGDSCNENAGEGNDTVSSSVTYTIGNNIENLILSLSVAVNGTGNSLNNIITGNNAVNTLNGMGGADTITGGVGSDIFAFTSLSHSTDSTRDLITDFSQGSDKISLAGLGFTGIQSGTGSGTILGYTIVAGHTIIDDANSTFSIDLNGSFTLTASDFQF